MNSTPFEIDPSAPDWFRSAIAHPTQSRFVDVAGCRIHYLAWFDPAASGGPAAARPGLLLIHGGGAHANWWRFIAPFFAASHRVCAIDLSGMGDSGGRETYAPDTWTAEIDAVLHDAGLYAEGTDANSPKPLVVGHSFGGFMAMKFGAESGQQLGGTVIVDSPVQDPSDTPLPEPATSTRTAPPLYSDHATALSRFRLMPAQPCDNAFITDFIARTSIRECDGGWTWKFDFKVMGSRRFGEPYRAELNALKGRAALIHGDKSAIVSPRTVAYMSALMGPESPVVEIPESHHHVMLDQPLAFVAALRAILDSWARDPV
jgi:pimeloyl-ACP methyl ester carboxylesterase